MKKQRTAIIGIGATRMSKSTSFSARRLYLEAAELALNDAKLGPKQIDGIITCGSLTEPIFERALDFAQCLGIEKLSYHDDVDHGGASPVKALLLAEREIMLGRAKTILVAAADNITCIPSEEFLRLANNAIGHPEFRGTAKPGIVLLYDKWAWKYYREFNADRCHLALVPVIMSQRAAKHPKALNQEVYSLDQVLTSPLIEGGRITKLLECAYRASGGGAIIICSEERAKDFSKKPIRVLGTGEAHTQKYYLPELYEDSCCRRAGITALKEAGMTIDDLPIIDWFGIYDCFPICFIRALEDLWLAGTGEGGYLVEKIANGKLEKPAFNTHGGLLSHGAPWGAPAIFSLIEAVEQLRGEAGKRQVENVTTALVYGNGGIFSSAAVAILGRD